MQRIYILKCHSFPGNTTHELGVAGISQCDFYVIFNVTLSETEKIDVFNNPFLKYSSTHW